MSLIDLEKKVGVVLEKRNLLHPPPTKVGLAIDGSGSMKPLYQNGVVERTVDRLLAVAARFDDDGTLDAWMFDHQTHPLPPATPADYNGYVAKHILTQYAINGGTRFHPVMEDVLRFYSPGPRAANVAPAGWLARMGRMFSGGPRPEASPVAAPAAVIPAFVLMIGDGENDQDDRPRTAQLLRSAARSGPPIYWQFVGIGKHTFKFMRSMADELPNVGFCEVRDIGAISDEALYETILSQEFIDWIRT